MCSIDGPPLRKPKLRMLPEDQPYPIYLDHNASTPVSDAAWDAMLSCREVWGNPSSAHPYGAQAKFVVENARATVAKSLGHGVSPNEVLFTSGGTEANNTAIFGGALSNRRLDPKRVRVISTVFEHPAVEEVLKVLESRDNFKIERLPVSQTTGVVDTKVFEQMITANGGASTIALITVMFANNEIGSIQPIGEMVKQTRKQEGGEQVIFHSDAAQVFGKIRVDVSDLGVDLLSVCSHKFYGPKGVGALYIRNGITVEQLMFGAGHERGMRPGTENIILIAGMAAALEKAVVEYEERSAHYRKTRDFLFERMSEYAKKAKLELQINGSLDSALPNTLNLAVFHPATGLYVSSAKLVQQLGSKVAFSFGSACHSVTEDEEIPISAPLKAIGVSSARAVGTLRLSTGDLSTLDDMNRAAQILIRASANQMPDY